MSTGSGWTFGVLGLVLNEFDQMIAKDHLSGRDGDRLADFKLIGAFRRLLPRAQALQIVDKIPEATDEIETPFRLSTHKYIRVCQRKIRRRDDVERLSHHEIEALGILLLNAAHSRDRGVPPFLRQEK